MKTEHNSIKKDLSIRKNRSNSKLSFKKISKKKTIRRMRPENKIKDV